MFRLPKLFFKTIIGGCKIIKMENIEISNSDLSENFINEGFDLNRLALYVINRKNLHENLTGDVKRQLSKSFLGKFNSKWSGVGENVTELERRHHVWWSNTIKFKFDTNDANNNIDIGRPQQGFSEICERTKQRRSNKLIAEHGFDQIQHAYLHGLNTSRKKNISKIISKLLTLPTDIVKAIMENLEENESVTMTSDSALALYIDMDLSKNSYQLLRRNALNHGCQLYPPYIQLGVAKAESHPTISSMTISASSASVSLQDLLDHTASRIIKSISEEVIADCNTTVELFSKWGCDGSSGQSEYKQSTSEVFSDKQIFMVSMVPLEMRNLQAVQSSDPLWKNPRPSSTKYCRPLLFKYCKETKETIQNEVDIVKRQIRNLEPTIVNVFGKTIKVVHILILSMIDGKVFQALADSSSSQKCLICGANPTDMNNLKTVIERPVREELLVYGLSTLHAWIRFMECILHIGYNMDFKKWKYVTANDKVLQTAAKERIQNDFRTQTGLIIDEAKHGHGNSNDGNTARRFFANPILTASITKVDVILITRFSIILQTLVSGCAVDPDKYHEYAMDTAKRFVKKYFWFYMPTSVHKILIHGSSIIRATVLPIGELSEEAQEARNKDFRNFRLNHTRKISRIDTNTDLFKWLLITSCPYLASIRYVPNKSHLEPDPEVLTLLK